MTTLLIVEDEQAIREMVALSLQGSNYELIEAETVNMARDQIALRLPALILLDLMLPDMDGLDFARQLKENEITQEIPIIMLTARSEEKSKIRGLECGADDYITKPFSPKEMIARVNAVLRRTGNKQLLSLNDLSLDVAAHRVKIGNQPLNLGPTEFRLIKFFLTNMERVYSRTQLLDHVWGRNVYVDDRTVDVHIRRLRKALAPFGYDRYIQTVRSSGYRLSKCE